MTASLPDAAWRHRPGLSNLLATLGADAGGARFVGGAVRDTLLGEDVKDVDIATPHSPDEVLQRLKAAHIKAVPTGIAHGTITAVLDGWPVEVTTLRRDVSTDGRRATIAYTADWREDAARRDFTINALYADPLTGEVSDFFGGIDDLAARHVRFIGHAEDRIAEDHLRILRYFRFFARFGEDAPDTDAYAACVARATSLMALSRERIADELLKLLALPDPAHSVRLMIEGGIFRPVIPEIGEGSLARLQTLIARERAAGLPPSALRRLCALLPQDAATGEAIAARLKLSNKARKRIALALGTDAAETPEALAYRIGKEGAIDRLLLTEAEPTRITNLNDWKIPEISVTGGNLISLGLTPGPDVAKALRQVEDQWVAEGFPPGPRLVQICAQIVSKFQRARQ